MRYFLAAVLVLCGACNVFAGDKFTECVVHTKSHMISKYQYKCDGEDGIRIVIFFEIVKHGTVDRVVSLDSAISELAIKDGWFIATIMEFKQESSPQPKDGIVVFSPANKGKEIRKQLSRNFKIIDLKNNAGIRLEIGKLIPVVFLLRAAESDGVGKSISRDAMFEKFIDGDYEIVLKQEDPRVYLLGTPTEVVDP